MTTTTKQQKTRVIMDVTDEMVTRLDMLKAKTGSATRTALVKRAIAYLDMFTNKQAEGYRPVFVKDDKEVEVVLIGLK